MSTKLPQSFSQAMYFKSLEAFISDILRPGSACHSTKIYIGIGYVLSSMNKDKVPAPMKLTFLIWADCLQSCKQVNRITSEKAKWCRENKTEEAMAPRMTWWREGPLRLG